MDIVIDVEADNLTPMTKNIWCVGVVEVGGKDRSKLCLEPESLRKLIPHCNRVITHNSLGFDLEAIRRVWGIPYTITGKGDTWDGHEVEFIDTCHLSQFLWPDRLGGHGLKPWGKRVGLEKIDFKDFSGGFTEEMGVYCLRDCEITKRVYLKLMEEME